MDRTLFRSLPLVGALLVLSAPPARGQAAPAGGIAQTPSQAVAEIRAARLAQNAALAVRQMDSVASFWTNDVVITASLGRVLRGKEAYREALASDTGTVYVRSPTKVETANPWQSAWEEGRWVGRRGLAGPVVIQGRYAAQWHRIGTRWLIRSEVFVALACAETACSRPLASP